MLCVFAVLEMFPATSIVAPVYAELSSGDETRIANVIRALPMCATATLRSSLVRDALAKVFIDLELEDQVRGCRDILNVMTFADQLLLPETPPEHAHVQSHDDCYDSTICSTCCISNNPARNGAKKSSSSALR
jgi:hypothetical protein